MIDWITDIWNMVTEVFQLVCTNIDELIDLIDAVDFTTAAPIFHFWGATRYVLGGPLYTIAISSITIGASLMIYKFTIQVIDIVKSLIPGLAGKLHFR